MNTGKWLIVFVYLNKNYIEIISMVNFKLTALIILISSSVFSHCLLGQTPLNDATWQIDTAKSDEFDGTVLNSAKWHILDCPSGDCCNFGGGTAFEKGNAIDS